MRDLQTGAEERRNVLTALAAAREVEIAPTHAPNLMRGGTCTSDRAELSARISRGRQRCALGLLAPLGRTRARRALPAVARHDSERRGQHRRLAQA
jgi:hypothetical protein